MDRKERKGVEKWGQGGDRKRESRLDEEGRKEGSYSGSKGRQVARWSGGVRWRKVIVARVGWSEAGEGKQERTFILLILLVFFFFSFFFTSQIKFVVFPFFMHS